MNYLTLTIISTILSVTFIILAQKLLSPKSDTQAFTVLTELTCALLIFPIIFFEGTTFPQGWRYLLLVFIAGLFYAIADHFSFKGRQIVPANLFEIAFQTLNIWTFLGGILLYHEEISILKIAGLILIILGNVYLLLNKKLSDSLNGLQYAFIYAFFLSLAFLIDKSFATKVSIAFYTFLTYFISGLINSIFIKFDVRRIKNEIRLQTWRIILLSLALGYSTVILIHAYSKGEITRIIPIWSSSILLVQLVSIVIFRDRKNVLKKIIASVIVFCGIILIRNS